MRLSRSPRLDRRSSVSIALVSIALVSIALVSIGFASAATAAAPPMRLQQLAFVATRENTTEVRVEAVAGVIEESIGKATLETVHAEWSGADGKPSLEITCERGELDLESNDLLASGDVHGTLADGRRFVGPWLRYDRARGVAFTDAPVQILEGSRVLRGGGFEYFVRDRRLRLTAGAKVEENTRP
jgi:LPS export ABC transporter protein LptC